jgi:hypothetical protein
MVFIELLVCPEAIRMTNNFGETPLIVACWHPPMPYEAIGEMIEMYAETLGIANRTGYLPLHFTSLV